MTDPPDDTQARTDGVGSDTPETSRPSVLDAQESSSAHNTSPESLPEYVSALPVRVWVLPALLIALFLPWASFSAPLVGQETLTGIDTDSGLLIGALLIIIAAAETLGIEGKRLKQVWMYVGGLILATAVLSLWYIRREIQTAMAELEGNPFAAGVDMSLGIGIYLTVLCAAIIVYFGYQMNRRHVRSARECVE